MYSINLYAPYENFIKSYTLKQDILDDCLIFIEKDIKLSKLDHINKRIGEKTPELFNKIKEQDSLFIQFLKEMNYDPNCNIIQLRELYNYYVDKRH